MLTHDLNPPVQELLPLLRCPATGAPLIPDDDGSLRTPDGLRTYPIVNGVPILIASERSLFDAAAMQLQDGQPSSAGRQGSRLKQFALWLLRLPPTASRNVAAAENFRALQRLLRDRAASSPDPTRVLVIGGGQEGAGAAGIDSDPAFELIETDVYLSPRTRIVCDGHDLPFADGSFDGVICQAVLEHVINPWRVADESHRVLKSGGFVYSEVPFMFQVHGGAFDFTRFSLLGHRRMWHGFDEIRAGAQGGPGMALIWSIQSFLRALLPPRLWPLGDRFSTLGFFWLKYLDGYLVNRPAGLDAASGTFFLGRRRNTPVDDRTIVRGYRGIGRRLDW